MYSLLLLNVSQVPTLSAKPCCSEVSSNSILPLKTSVHLFYLANDSVPEHKGSAFSTHYTLDQGQLRRRISFPSALNNCALLLDASLLKEQSDVGMRHVYCICC